MSGGSFQSSFRRSFPSRAGRTADSAQGALTISLSSSVAAGIHHPDMAEGKIVPDRVDRIDRTQRRRNFRGHLPIRCAIARQSEAPPQPNDVRIERNDEPGWGHECPRSKVDLVAPNHPTQKQIETLAGASGRRPGEEKTDACPLWHSVVSGAEIRRQRACRERVQRRPDIRSRRIVTGNEEALDGTGFAKHPLQDDQQRHEIPPSDPAVDDRIDRCSIACRIEAPHEPRRMRAHRCEERLDRVQDARDAAKRERRSAEPDDLAVLRRRVAPDDVNRIGRRVDVVKRPVEIFETQGQIAARIPNPDSRIPTGPTSGTA